MYSISQAEFDGYCDEVEKALNLCYERKRRRKIEAVARQMIEGVTIEDRRKARAVLVNVLEGIYAQSANLQAVAVDKLCKEAIGVPKTYQTYSLGEESARDIIGEFATGLDTSRNYEEFARGVCERLENELRFVANEHMENNAVRGKGKGVKFMYVPRGPVICGFCCMMVLEGPVFSKGAKARLHENCDCKLMPADESTRIGNHSPGWYKKGYESLYVGKSANGKPAFKRGLGFDIRSGSIVERPDRYKSAGALAVKAKSPKAYRAWVSRVKSGPFTIKQTANVHTPGKAFERTSEARDKRQSTLYLSEDEQYLLVQKHAGKGVPDLTRNGEWRDAEVCVADDYIGEIVGNDGLPVKTKAFRIHYADNGVHVVPRWDGSKNGS